MAINDQAIRFSQGNLDGDGDYFTYVFYNPSKKLIEACNVILRETFKSLTEQKLQNFYNNDYSGSLDAKIAGVSNSNKSLQEGKGVLIVLDDIPFWSHQNVKMLLLEALQDMILNSGKDCWDDICHLAVIASKFEAELPLF